MEQSSVSMLRENSSLYFVLRFLRLAVTGLSLPLGIVYYNHFGTALSTPVVVGAVFLVFLPWSMLFVALSEETYSGSVKKLTTALLLSLVGFAYNLFSSPASWQFAFYSWLLASFIAIALGLALFFLYTVPKNAHGEKILPWWGIIGAVLSLGFIVYFISLFGIPFTKELVSTDRSIFEKSTTVIIFISSIANIGGSSFYLLTHTTPENTFTTPPQNERYRSFVVICSIILVVITFALLFLSTLA